MKKIVIVEDHPIVLEGLKQLITTTNEVHIVGCFYSGKEAQQFIIQNQTNIDIVLLDISLPDADGMQICKEIRSINSSIKIIIISNHNEASIIFKAIQNGANGYLLKNATPTELRNAILNQQNKLIVSTEVENIITKAESQAQKLPALTKREIQVLQKVLEGKTSAQIADELFLSSLTVDTHRKNFMQKLQVKNIIELIAAAKDYNL
nr:response regulator transcription factor [uncultured Flavobacterium sp.]